MNKGVKLLDTTSSLPGYRTASPPPDKPFTLRTHMFTSMAAVKSYWTDLKCVCLNTPLGKWMAAICFLVKKKQNQRHNYYSCLMINTSMWDFSTSLLNKCWVLLARVQIPLKIAIHYNVHVLISSFDIVGSIKKKSKTCQTGIRGNLIQLGQIYMSLFLGSKKMLDFVQAFLTLHSACVQHWMNVG